MTSDPDALTCIVEHRLPKHEIVKQRWHVHVLEDREGGHWVSGRDKGPCTGLLHVRPAGMTQVMRLIVHGLHDSPACHSQAQGAMTRGQQARIGGSRTSQRQG